MAIDMARFFGVWNWCQSRRVTNWSIKFRKSATVVSLSIMALLVELVEKWRLAPSPYA